MASRKAGLDPASTAPALAYTGDRYVPGVPARDLTESDVCRLANTRDATPEAVLAELIASGLYAPATEA